MLPLSNHPTHLLPGKTQTFSRAVHPPVMTDNRSSSHSAVKFSGGMDAGTLVGITASLGLVAVYVHQKRLNRAAAARQAKHAAEQAERAAAAQAKQQTKQAATEQAKQAATEQAKQATAAWVKLLPFIFDGTVPKDTLSRAILQVERRMDFNPNLPRLKYHPNEAELMASLKSPALGPYVHNRLSSALSSVFHWIGTSHTVTGQHLNIWGDLGLLAHGFKFWKYDAQGAENSLFAQYGCKSVQVDESNKRFGNGFSFEKSLNLQSKLNAKTQVMLLRGVLLVSHPKYGTLAVRNSSLAFGRDLLVHPAYYTNQSHTGQTLAKVPNQIQSDWTSVLDWRLEHDRKYNNVEFLTNQLLQFKQDYQLWKFDTTRFDKNKQFTGHLNGGLKAMAEYLKTKQALNESSDSKKPLPSLAFVHPDLPPYASYSFTNASDETVDKLPMTKSRIQELSDFATGNWSDKKYPNSSLQAFLQEGIQQQGELIMTDPDEG